MTDFDSTHDVIVVGAGLVGSAFALLLSKEFAQSSEIKIAVVEQAPMSIESALTDPGQENQRVVALGEAATAVLKKVGVFESLEANACHAYDKMFVWDEGGNGELAFSAQDYQKDSLGHLIDSQKCTALLQSQLADVQNIETFYNFSAESLSLQTGKSLHESSNVTSSVSELRSESHTLRAPLVVAADGGRSWVRQQAKIMSIGHDYEQRGIVTKIRTELSHQDTAWQRFLETGPLAVLPLANNQSSIVWSANLSLADKLMAASDSEFEAALMSALEARLGKIEVLSRRLSFPLKSQKAECYFKRGVVLIGDAAHSIHPLAGQGANLGFKDAARLAKVLSSDIFDGACLGDIACLERYQRARKLDNQQTDMLMTALHLAYQNNNPWWLGARSLGMNWLDSSNMIKNLLAKHAMGIN